jgi:hypothetical protein
MQFGNNVRWMRSMIVLPGDNIVQDVLTNNGERSAAAVALGERQ